MITTINVGNVVEFNDRTFRKRAYKSAQFENASDHALFWGENDRVVITERKLLQNHVEHIKNLLGIKRCVVYAADADLPGQTLSETLINSSLWDELDFADKVQINSYGATRQIYRFVEFIRKTYRIEIELSFPDEEKYWSSVYLDSKIGAKNLLTEINIPVPRTLAVLNDPGMLFEASRHFVDVQEKIILKSNQDHGGMGSIVILSKNNLDQLNASINRLMIKRDSWKSGPIIIEEIIGNPMTNAAFTFTGLIQENNTQSMGVNRMYIEAGKEFVGFEQGLDVIDKSIYDRIEGLGLTIGNRISKLGYSGWFDVDFVMESPNTEIFATEINARRNSATFVFNLLQILHGKDWQNRVAVVEIDEALVSSEISGYRAILDLIGRIESNFSFQIQIIPTAVAKLNSLEPRLGYVMIAKDINLVRKAHKVFEHSLQTK